MKSVLFVICAMILAFEPAEVRASSISERNGGEATYQAAAMRTTDDSKLLPAAEPVATPEIADQLSKLQGELASLKDYVSGRESSSFFFLNLPEKLYALVGEELNIYFDNLVVGHDTDYDFDVDCSIGMQLERCFRVVPTRPGTYSLFLAATDKKGVTLRKKCTIYVADKSAGAGKDSSIIFIGDSTIDNNSFIGRLNMDFSEDCMSLSTLGTRGSGKNRHEGRSGWSFKSYYTKSGETNPFFNPETGTFDASHYFSETKIDKPDWIFINLGINDTFPYTDDETLNEAITEMNSMCDNMIVDIRSVSPQTKIGISLTIPPNYSQDAFGKNYKNNQTRSRYKRNNVIWVNNLLNRYENREKEQIYVIPIHTNLDTKYNMGMESISQNKRNTETYLSPVAIGGVHPSDPGYWQIADVYWFFLKAMEQYSKKETDQK